MLVVSDTSPLNYLVLIGHDAVLPQLFGRVLAPPAVITELRHPGAPVKVRAWVADAPPWLEIVAPASVDLSLGLGKGEAEAISLAREVSADVVLIDERKGEHAATRLGLVVAGTLAVLRLAAEKQLLDLPSAIGLLRGTNFRVADRLLNELLERFRTTRGDGDR